MIRFTTVAQFSRGVLLPLKVCHTLSQPLETQISCLAHPFSSFPSPTANDSADIRLFASPKSAYRNKSTVELLRALLVFKICGLQPLVKNAEKLFRISSSLLGKRVPLFFIKHTLFAHFCAGREVDLAKTLKRLQSIGLFAILDYAAERDVSHKGVSSPPPPPPPLPFQEKEEKIER